VLRRLYKPFLLNGHPILFMDIPSAEMTKYAANAMLATRISFMNELSRLCDRVGADINWVRKGIGADPRIGPKFLYAGIGYGGSCFPKDVKALIKTGEENGVDLKIIKSVELVNQEQKRVLVEKVLRHYNNDVKGKTFTVWGLAFKPNTDDMREAPSITIINELLEHGAKIKAYDPVATENAKKIFGDKIEYATDQYDALLDSDGLLLVTEWNEFRFINYKVAERLMNAKVIFDGRNIYEPEEVRQHGFLYYGIGRK
jgi:UDPglucose 6-dehydrogenase